MKHIYSNIFCSEESCRTFFSTSSFFLWLLTAIDPLCSVICLFFFLKKLQLFRLLSAVAMDDHMSHVSAFWRLSLGHVIFSSPWRGDKSAIPSIICFFFSFFFTHSYIWGVAGFDAAPWFLAETTTSSVQGCNPTLVSVTSLLWEPADRICTKWSATCRTWWNQF